MGRQRSKLLTVGQVAGCVGVDRKTVTAWRKVPGFPRQDHGETDDSYIGRVVDWMSERDVGGANDPPDIGALKARALQVRIERDELATIKGREKVAAELIDGVCHLVVLAMMRLSDKLTRAGLAVEDLRKVAAAVEEAADEVRGIRQAGQQ